MKTFYLAGPYGERKLIDSLARELAEIGRMRWYADHNWTDDRLALNYDDPLAPALSVMDLGAAGAADLFVLWRSPAVSLGSHAELGARLVLWKEAHVVLNGNEPHMFYRHPLVHLHETWQAFLEWFALERLGKPIDRPAGDLPPFITRTTHTPEP